MICSIKPTKLMAFISFLLVGSFVAGYAFAEDSDDASPLRFYKGQNGSYLQGTIKAELAYFNQNIQYKIKS